MCSAIPSSPFKELEIFLCQDINNNVKGRALDRKINEAYNENLIDFAGSGTASL